MLAEKHQASPHRQHRGTVLRPHGNTKHEWRGGSRFTLQNGPALEPRAAARKPQVDLYPAIELQAASPGVAPGVAPPGVTAVADDSPCGGALRRARPDKECDSYGNRRTRTGR